MRITRIAEALHVLPYSGGLFDQPPGAIFKMEAILVASTQPATARDNRAAAEARIQERLKN
jgi:hypothetical protein